LSIFHKGGGHTTSNWDRLNVSILSIFLYFLLFYDFQLLLKFRYFFRFSMHKNTNK
jgi:hypothetical protein